VKKRTGPQSAFALLLSGLLLVLPGCEREVASTPTASPSPATFETPEIKPEPEEKPEVEVGNVDLSEHSWSVYSQSGEDGVLDALFRVIEPTSKYAIEFGAGDGASGSNVRNLILNRDWEALLLEGDDKLAAQMAETYKDYPKVTAKQAWVYPGNVELLFEDNDVPEDVDLLVIDIDSNDYYIWKVIHNFRPKVVIVEYNASFPPPEKAVVQFHPMNYWDKDDYYGASLQSLYDLGQKKGYELVYCTDLGNNAIFVDRKYYDRLGIEDNSPEALYKLPKYGKSGRAPNGGGHPQMDAEYEVDGIKKRRFKDHLEWKEIKIPKKFRHDI